MLFLFMRYQNEVNEKPSPSVDYQLSSHCQCFKIEVSGFKSYFARAFVFSAITERKN